MSRTRIFIVVSVMIFTVISPVIADPGYDWCWIYNPGCDLNCATVVTFPVNGWPDAGFSLPDTAVIITTDFDLGSWAASNPGAAIALFKFKSDGLGLIDYIQCIPDPDTLDQSCELNGAECALGYFFNYQNDPNCTGAPSNMFTLPVYDIYGNSENTDANGNVLPPDDGSYECWDQPYL